VAPLPDGQILMAAGSQCVDERFDEQWVPVCKELFWNKDRKYDCKIGDSAVQAAGFASMVELQLIQ
jgi:hypothetical protein